MAIVITIESIVLFVMAFLGALMSALEGWIASGEEFKQRKFMASILRGLMFAAALFTAEFADIIEVNLTVILLALVGGFAFDAAANRASKAIGVRARENA